MKRPTCGAIHIFTAGPRDIVDGEWWCHCGFEQKPIGVTREARRIKQVAA